MFPKYVLLVSVVQVTLFLRSAVAGIRPLDRDGRNIYARGFDHSARDDDCGNGCPEPTGNFGSCTVPEIEFGQGFDGRKETSFRAVDQKSYPHGSADDINIISQSICNQLPDICKADRTAIAICSSAMNVASHATPINTGIQADEFNFVFGIATSYVDVPVYDNQGNIVYGSDNGSGDGAGD